MVSTLLWLYEQLVYKYYHTVKLGLSRKFEGYEYVEVDLPRFARLSQKVKTKNGIKRQLKLLQEQGYVSIYKHSGRLYYRMLPRNSPDTHRLFTVRSPDVHPLIIDGNMKMEDGNESPSERPKWEVDYMKSPNLVRLYEYYKEVRREYGYMVKTKPTEKEVRALRGLMRAFENAEALLPAYIGSSVVEWNAIRKELGDWKMEPTPTLHELCVKRESIVKALSIIRQRKEESKLQEADFSPEILNKVRRNA